MKLKQNKLFCREMLNGLTPIPQGGYSTFQVAYMCVHIHMIITWI